MTRIAIAGMACRYPDARTSRELWENVLARRQAFRRIPPERLPLDDYYSPDASVPDRTYSARAAVLTDWTFDRETFRVSEATYEATDPAHWLALQVASEAVTDCGVSLPLDRTAVIVGNTLTGDSSRAHSLRLRWPYVRRAAEGAGGDAEFLRAFEARFKAPFAEIGEESLAGGLSNTIAGRICNYFGLQGGGFTIDGACSSSLLAIAQACSALDAGDVDAVIAGGVDLSLDPFELIGFAKCTALARERMFVYDRRANGFLPGEGCGFVVLLREADAPRAYATIAGWGISSDGHGGMTRPELRGQRLALQRAYERAGFDVRSVAYFEGHGTGTPVGDPIEIATIQSLLGDDDRPHYLGSIKANIGHTKAAAGIAGLLKATLAVHHGVIPPATACEQPRAELGGALRVSATALPWSEATRRAGVSAMGFGGINAHVIVESASAPHPSPAIASCETTLLLFDGTSAEDVQREVHAVVARLPELSIAEVTDLAHALQRRLRGGAWRAAIDPASSSPPRIVHVEKPPRVAFLFSGQASIPFAEQRTIVEASLDALDRLRGLGIEADVAIGHSLGEITALHWAGAFSRDALLQLVTARGEAMKAIAGDGAMAAFACDAVEATQFGLAVAAINAPRQTVLSGPRDAVERAMRSAAARGVAATLLPVAAAFHSPMMAAAEAPLRHALERMHFEPLQRRVISTIGGDDDLRERLVRQLTSPVRFHDALQQLDADLIVEAGPGRVLAQLANGIASDDLQACIAAFWLAGGALRHEALFHGRFTRPFDPERRPTFITSPCERRGSAPRTEAALVTNDAADAESLLRTLVAAQTALGIDVIERSSRFLSDLHLSSITVGRILGEAARAIGAPPLLDATSLANATIAEAAAALEHARREPQLEPPPDGLEPWVRAFEVVETRAPRPARRVSDESSWRFYGRAWPELRERFATVRGRGAVLLASDHAALLQLARELRDGDRVVVVQDDVTVAGFARTLFLERPHVSVRIVTSRSPDEIAEEAEAGGAFGEATWRDGVRHEPRVRVFTPHATTPRLTGDDTILVTGGTRGIGLALAQHLAKRSGAKLVLVGRSTGHDVTRPLETIENITAIIHAAGINEPALIDDLDEGLLERTIAVKRAGLRNVLNAVDAKKLRLLVTFGSVIARTGLRGEAHYALANEGLARDTEAFARAHPRCRTLCLEWSVWAAAGMGVRLGAIDSLRRQGVVPIHEEDALHLATQLVDGSSATRVIVAGRLGDPPTIRYAHDEPPLLRFVDAIQVHVPGVELVTDTTLSLRNDPYLADHVVKGEAILPAVMGLEAMAQAAFATSSSTPRRATNIDLRRPIHPATLRIAALTANDRVDTAIRTSDTQFAVDHFRATFHAAPQHEPRIDVSETASLDASDVYEHLLFHTNRFRRITRYRHLGAFECIAEITPSHDPWFHKYAAQHTLLGDAAMRDAAIHALQACIPQAVVLPVAVRSIDFHQPLTRDAILRAHEVARDGDDLVWDLDVVALNGDLIEQWRGLRLRPVERRITLDHLPPALWGPLLERECNVRVFIGSASSDDAMRAAARTQALPVRRDDGKPRLDGHHVSASHDGALTMGVAAQSAVGCDLQVVDGHPWATILHPRDLALANVCAEASGDDERVAAARVWAARESAVKACGDALLPLTFDAAGPLRRVTFAAGNTRVDTFAIGDRIAAIAHQLERS